MSNSTVRDNRLTSDAPIIGVSGDHSNLKYNTGVDIGAGGKLNTGQDIGTAGTVTVTNGLGTDALQSLLGNLQSATSDQIKAVTSAGSDQLSSVLAANKDQLSTLGDLLKQTQDAQSGSPNVLMIVLVVAIGAVALIFYKRTKG